MSNPNEIELTEVEQNWLDEFNDVMYKMPKALTLTINSLGDGQVEVFSQQVKISPLLNLGGLKESSQFWRHSQIRQSFGLYRTLMDSMWEKDTPLNFTVPVTAGYGAVATYSDNYCDFYIASFPVEYREFSSTDRQEHDYVKLRSCLGDLKIWHVDKDVRRLSR